MRSFPFTNQRNESALSDFMWSLTINDKEIRAERWLGSERLQSVRILIRVFSLVFSYRFYAFEKALRIVEDKQTLTWIFFLGIKLNDTHYVRLKAVSVKVSIQIIDGSILSFLWQVSLWILSGSHFHLSSVASSTRLTGRHNNVRLAVHAGRMEMARQDLAASILSVNLQFSVEEFSFVSSSEALFVMTAWLILHFRDG